MRIGAGITDQDRNVLTNQHLLLRTFRSTAPLLTKGSSAFPLVLPKGKTKAKHSNIPKTRHAPRYDADDDDDDDPGLELNDDVEPIEVETLFMPRSTEFLRPEREGTLLITLLNQPPYTLWDLPHLATRPPPFCPGTRLPQPRYRLLRSFEFRPEVYEGYEHRRTIGFKEGFSKVRNEEILGRKGKARTWECGLALGRDN